MSVGTQLSSQVKFDLLAFRRNPAATFFTLALPVIFLVLFTSIFGNEIMDNGTRVAVFYVPGIVALSVVSTTMINIAITMVTKREMGILKRVRGTPLRPGVFVASQILASILLMIVLTAIVCGIGWLLFDVTIRAAGVPTLLLTLTVGAASFCAMGLALTTIIPSVDAAPAVTNAIALPLYFISDIFIPGDQVPSWVQNIGNLFPIRHLNKALLESFDPFVSGTSFPWGHWAVIAAWGAVGAVVAAAKFRWSPWGS